MIQDFLKTKIYDYSETLKRFLKNEYKWIIATIIAVPASVLAYQNIKIENRSDSFYYVPPYFNGDVDELKNTECWIGSVSTNRSDAFRCSSDNSILDPCFEDPILLPPDSVITCPSDPTDKNPLQFKAEIDRKHANDGAKNQESNCPWFIIMDDGSLCFARTGASEIIAGRRVDYSCKDGGKITGLSLPVAQKDGKLYISCFFDNRLAENCLIKEAWY